MTKAVVLSDYGPPEVLVPGEVEIGPPGTGQIRVNVAFAGVGPDRPGDQVRSAEGRVRRPAGVGARV